MKQERLRKGVECSSVHLRRSTADLIDGCKQKLYRIARIIVKKNCASLLKKINMFIKPAACDATPKMYSRNLLPSSLVTASRNPDLNQKD